MGINTKKLLSLNPSGAPIVPFAGGNVSNENASYVEKFSTEQLNEVFKYKDKNGKSWPDPPNVYTGVNGNLPDTNMKYLSEIGLGGFKLRTDAANAFIRMVQDMRKVGLNPTLNGTKTAYRTYAGQYSLLDPTKWVKAGKSTGIGLYQTTSGATAARPGNSNHGLGIAVDIASSTGDATGKNQVQCWMKWFGGEYGWVWAGSLFWENWHFEYMPEAWVDEVIGFEGTKKNVRYGRYDWGWKNSARGVSKGNKKIKGYCSIGTGEKYIGKMDIKSLKP